MTNEVKIVLKAVDDGFDRTITRAQGSTERLTGTLRSMGHAASGLVLGSIFTGWAGHASRVMDDFTTLNSRLRLAEGGAVDAASAYSQLFAVAQESRVSFTELGGTYAQIARSTKELGISQSELIGVTRTISQSMAISGGSANSMQAALLQLSQGLASGTLRGDELNSIMEQTPRLAKAIADGLGIGIGELRRWGEEGKLSAEAVMEALKKAAPQINEEFAKVTPTIGAAFTALSNAAGDALSKLDAAGNVTPRIAEAMTGLANSITQAVESAEKADSLFKLLEILLAVGASRGALALLGRVGGGAAAGTLAGGPVGTAVGAGVGLLAFAATADMSDYGASMKPPRLELPKARDPGNPVGDLEREVFGKLTRETPKELRSKLQAHIAARNELVEVFKKEAKKQKLADGDTGYADLYGDLVKKIAEEDEKFSKEALGKATQAKEKLRGLLDEGSGLSGGYHADLKALADGYAHGGVSLDQYRAAVERLIAKQPFAIALAKGEAETIKEREKLSERRTAQDAKVAENHEAARRSLADFIAEQEFEVSLIGQSAVARAHAQELRKIDIQLARDLTAAEKALGNRGESNRINTDLDSAKAQLQATAEERRAALQQRHAAAAARAGDWASGAADTLTKYRDTVADVAGFAEGAFTRAFQGMEDALVNFVKTGKLDFASLADSIISDLIRIQVRQAMTAALGGVQSAGGIGGFLSSLLGSGASASAASAGEGAALSGSFEAAASTLMMVAKGDVFTSPDLHQYANTIRSSPTLFKYAKGGAFGLMGEAGPEAIVPLARGPGGVLGIQKFGDGQAAAGAAAPEVTVNVINQGQPMKARQQGGPRFDGRRMIIDVVLEEMETNPNFRAAFGG